MEKRQNITLNLPRQLLNRVKRLAAEREMSMSALMTEALNDLVKKDRGYAAARALSLAALRSPKNLGTYGRPPCSRDELHER
jgi:predicted transcriptional regulator